MSHAVGVAPLQRNRKLLMGVCVLLAHKFTAKTDHDMNKVNILAELERELVRPFHNPVDEVLHTRHARLSSSLLLFRMRRVVQRVPRKQMLKAEFSVFARLEFGLFVPTHEHDPHFKRILRVRACTPCPHMLLRGGIRQLC